MSVMKKGRICGVNEIAETFGVSATTVDTWLRNGAPYVKQGSKGKSWGINTAEISKWLRARELELNGLTSESGEELKKRKLAAETGKAELELAKIKGEVVPLKQLERALSNVFAELKTNIRNIPARCATTLVGEQSETRIKEIMLRELDIALESLSEIDLEEPEGDDE